MTSEQWWLNFDWLARLNDVLEEIDDRRTGRVTTFEDKFGNVSVYEYLYDYKNGECCTT